VDADILKVGHHASTSGSGHEFISSVSPEISIIEVGADNDYGHPHTEILQRLQSVSTVYRTDHHGTISITTDGSTYTVTTEKIAGGKNSITSTVTTTDTTTRSASKGAVVSPVETSTIDEGIKIISLSLKEEFVKIRDPVFSSVDLMGWQIKDEDDKHTSTSSSFELESNGISGDPLWNNDVDTASLYYNEGSLADSLRG